MEKFLSFSNSEFEKIIREELEMPDGFVSLADALSVKILNFAECELSTADLETLYLFENLEELVFEKSKGIIDFASFVPFKKLKRLIVGGCLMSDVKLINIGALETLKNLEYLSIGDFGEIDLGTIDKLKHLKELCIGWGGTVLNCEKLKELINLTSLDLYDISIKSLYFLNELSSDVSLNLGGLLVEDEFDLNCLKRFKNCEWEMISIKGKML